MQYCEKCHTLIPQPYCGACGNKLLRAPNSDDYCFLIEADNLFGEMFKGILEDESIPYVDTPAGNGVRSRFALRLDRLKIYVPYAFYDRADEILKDIFSSIENAQKEELEKNIDKLFLSPRNEKKIRKALKMPDSDSLIARCADMVMNADRIVNNGRISSSPGGDYLFVYKNKDLAVINSATYEIISLEKQK